MFSMLTWILGAKERVQGTLICPTGQYSIRVDGDYKRRFSLTAMVMLMVMLMVMVMVVMVMTVMVMVTDQYSIRVDGIIKDGTRSHRAQNS